VGARFIARQSLRLGFGVEGLRECKERLLSLTDVLLGLRHERHEVLRLERLLARSAIHVRLQRTHQPCLIVRTPCTDRLDRVEGDPLSEFSRVDAVEQFADRASKG
jgi:hypothetical protein